MELKKWQERLFNNEYKEISPLEFGMNHEAVINALGIPDDHSTEKPSRIYKYLDIELHFNSLDNYKLFQIYSDNKQLLTIQFESDLYCELADLLKDLTVDHDIYNQIFLEGHELIMAYKDKGGTQGSAYNTVMHLFMENRRAGGDLQEEREDLIGDWLDCMCGYVGKDVVIW